MATTTNEAGILVIETNQGPRGTAGQGVPVGGTTGQFLKKKTATDYDTEWSSSAATVTSINDIGDVVITTPTNGQVLKYDSTNGTWVNGTDGGTTSIAWGSITGTLSSQVDLQSALDGKSGTGHTHFGVYEPANANIQSHIADSTVHFTQAAISITTSQISDFGSYETAFTKNTAFNKDFGTLIGTVCQGNDARLSDARTPVAHNHVEADITDLDKYTQSQVDTLLTGKSDTTHNHTGVYEPANANIQAHVSSTSNPHSVTAAQVGAYTSGAVDTLLSGKSDTSHSHTLDGLSDVVITTAATGQVLKFNGTNWINDADVAGSAPAWGAILGTLSDQIDLQSALDGKSATSHNHSGVYQPVDGDLTAIAALVGTSGILTKTAADTWSLDTNTYSTTSHNHTGTYEPANANIQSHIADGTVHFTQASISITESQISDLGTYEPAFTKNTAFNKDFGSTVGTVCQGNDARLSDARTPTAHTHVEADITDLDKYSQSQVDTLLTGKSDTTHDHNSVYQPLPAAGSAQTTDATPTVLHTAAIPTDQERIVTVRVRAHEDATDDMLWKTMTFGVKNIAGVASLVGGVDSAVGYDAGASAWAVVAGVSSGNVTITVTGQSLKTINWVSSIDTY